MSTSYHHVQLKIEGGELHRGFVCTAPEDAICRRRPAGFEEGLMESWTAEQATETGWPCWAVEWVEAAGIEDAILGQEDGVLASVPVAISYDEGVSITPVSTHETAEVR
ncbi:hypothetical protein ACIPVB_09050 [Microbacterium sp. NPDC090007]|uniref:hypothetical protein n=1 Tax=Microbacterium sp. NPDC090007 TaxID=3364204 RepID=UPI00382CE63B